MGSSHRPGFTVRFLVLSGRIRPRCDRGVLIACLSLALLVGCDEDPGPGDAGPTCTVDEDCDDGVWCNGTETCDPTSPTANPLGCLPGARPCEAGRGCDEETESCGPECSAPDSDGDGVEALECGGRDCDDTDPGRFAGNEEVCDLEGVDEDCNDATVGNRDLDRDGYVDARCCNGDACGGDCDETRRGTNPDAPEVCDGRDNDCDGSIDEGLLESRFADRDRDLHGDPDEPIMACPGTAGTSGSSLDCDDGNVAVNTPQGEIIDGEDNDCDGAIDEDPVEVLWYPDADGDGYGDGSGTTILSDTLQEGYSVLPTDCADDDEGRNPAATELCNGLDDDCNGQADYELGVNDWEDDDGDGFPDSTCPSGGTDCDDTDPFTRPDQLEICDLRDNDCDGTIDEGCAEDVPDMGTPDMGLPPGIVTWPFTIGGEAPTPDRCAQALIETVRFTLNGNTGLVVAEAPCASGQVVLPTLQGVIGEGVLEPRDFRGVVVPDSAGDPEGATAMVTLTAGMDARILAPADFGAARPSAWEVCDGFDNDGDGTVDPGCSDAVVKMVSVDPLCVLRERGSTSCWDETSEAVIPGDPDIRFAVDYDIGRGTNGAPLDCVVWFDGKVGCRGANILGSAGVPERAVGGCERLGTPYPCAKDFGVVPGVEQATSVGVGSGFGCALTAGGVRCWGTSESGRTGAGIDPAATPERVPPTLVAGLTAPLQLAVGGVAACVTQTDAPPACWGRGLAIGDGVGADSATPRPMDTTDLLGAEPTIVLSNGDLGCASASTGTYCWGRFPWVDDDPLTPGADDEELSPVRLTDPSVFWPGSTTVVATDGSVRYWASSSSIFGPLVGGMPMPFVGWTTDADPSGLLEIRAVFSERACLRYGGGLVRCYEDAGASFEVTF